MSRIADRRVLITGAARGMGRLMAERMHALGAVVLLADVNEEGVRSLADELGGGSGVRLRREPARVGSRAPRDGRPRRHPHQQRGRDLDRRLRRDSRRIRSADARRQRRRRLLDDQGISARSDRLRRGASRHEPERVVERVLVGIQKNRPYVREPWLVKTTPLLRGLLPARLADAISSVLGTGRVVPREPR